MVKLANFIRNLIRTNLEKAKGQTRLTWEDHSLILNLDSHRENTRSILYSTLKWSEAKKIFTLILGTKGTQAEIICSLMHELGHYLADKYLTPVSALESHRDLIIMRGGEGASSFIIEKEVEAWEDGYEYFIAHGIPVPFGYVRRMTHALASYLIKAEDTELWTNKIGRSVAIISLKEERQ